MSANAGAGAQSVSGSFGVDLPVFAGPFRLLADLILEQKVDVCDVQVASITDRYLAHTSDADGWNLEEATWFLAICAVLLELKVGRLMPRHREPDEEDLLGAHPIFAYARSLELTAFRRVALEIARRLEDEAGTSRRDVGPGPSSPTCTRTRWFTSCRRSWPRSPPRSCGRRPCSTSPTSRRSATP